MVKNCGDSLGIVVFPTLPAMSPREMFTVHAYAFSDNIDSRTW